MMVFHKHIDQFWERWNGYIPPKFYLPALKAPEHETTSRYKKTAERETVAEPVGSWGREEGAGGKFF